MLIIIHLTLILEFWEWFWRFCICFYNLSPREWFSS